MTSTVKLLLAASVLAMTTAGLALAASDTPTNLSTDSVAPASEMTLTQGVIKKVDTEQGKLTIQHGPIENLGMPPMTMRFKVGDAAQLTQVKPGDAIRFHVERDEGAFVVRYLELAP